VPGPFAFAWAGGTITDQVTLVTNGTTHGASFETMALVGDVVAGEQQLFNLASTARLEDGSYYELSGPGIAGGTRFLYDNTILSGLPASVNLTVAATSDQTSATLTAKKAVSVGVGLATLTDGSASLTLSDVGSLPAGTYGVTGINMETDVPVSTLEGSSYTGGGGVLIISAAYLIYDGAGGGSLAILAATPNVTTGTDDEFGMPTTVTTYAVAQQEVRATAAGQYPLQLFGFPSDDPASITDIPSIALGTLEPGLVYNITGNGIPVSATFVAPASGTSITLDLDATASDLNAILTVTGPRTPNAPFDASSHNRFDEDILSIEIAQEEGGFATLTVDIKNPNIGLLALGRNLWCWLSWDQAWPDGTPDLVPLFNGRLIGVPKLSAGEVVQIQFLARPDDLNVQKTALAESLKVLPWYDPVWLTAETTADTVLEAYSALWHIDPTTLTVTTSDILEGEDGIIDIDESQSIYDKFSLSYGQPPLVATTVTGTVSWQQQAEGVLDVTQTLLDAFHAEGSAYTQTYPRGVNRGFTGINAYWYTFGQRKSVAPWSTGGGGVIQCLGDGGIESSWPSQGTNIGGGWSLSNLTDMDGVPLCYIRDASKTKKGGWLEPAYYTVTFTAAKPVDNAFDEAAPARGVRLVTQPYGTYTVDFPLRAYKIRMNLEYRANRTRSETVTAVVTAGVQRELSDSAESDRETIGLTSRFVAEGVDPDGALPIGDVAYRSYFQTARGTSSLEYLLLAARAKMRARARAVDVGFAVDWRTALPITLRHSVRYADRRVPGGIATGKVKSYSLTASTAGMLGEFTIGCTIGTDETVTPQAGVNSYVDTGYVDDWQVISGMQTAIDSGDCSYQTLDDFVIADDGVDLTHVTVDSVVNECVVINGIKTQMQTASNFQDTIAPTSGDLATTMQKVETKVTLDLKPLAGAEYHTEFFPAVTPLTIPKTIDLSAPGE
jgi:hypothetical protein